MIALDVRMHGVNAADVACRIAIRKHADADTPRRMARKMCITLVRDGLAIERAQGVTLDLGELFFADHVAPVFTDDVLHAAVEPFTGDAVNEEIAEIAIRL